MIDLETVKADLINTKDSKSFVNYSLSVDESIEIVNRAMAAEKALELMADYISASEECQCCRFHDEQTPCGVHAGKYTCSMFIVDWFVKKAIITDTKQAAMASIEWKMRRIGGYHEKVCPDCGRKEIKTPIMTNMPYCSGCHKIVLDCTQKYCCWCGVEFEKARTSND